MILQFPTKLSPNQYYMLMHENEERNQSFMQAVLDKATFGLYNIYHNQELVASKPSLNQAIGYLAAQIAGKEYTTLTSSQWHKLVIRQGQDVWYVNKL